MSRSTIATARQLLEDGSNGLTIALCADLYTALKALWEISGEANIPMTSTKAVRRMAKFLEARQNAEKVLDRAELKGFAK
jgi:hypothetical protein